MSAYMIQRGACVRRSRRGYPGAKTVTRINVGQLLEKEGTVYYQGVHPNDHLWYALGNNLTETFLPESVTDIVAEVPGENDELCWWWVLEIKGGGFMLLEGWCDYTGWDCQSGIEERGVFPTAIAAAEAAPEDDGSHRSIRRNLIAQVEGTQPKFLYVA